MLAMCLTKWLPVLGFFVSTDAKPLLEPRSSMKVMIIGDSISHGFNADYTWRYRIWQWFQSNNIAMSFVGPFEGTLPQTVGTAPTPPLLQGEVAPTTEPATTGAYAADVDADFLANSLHYCLWGRQLAQDVSSIQDIVATYSPDLLLVALGFNDIGWFITEPDGTLTNMNSFVTNARAANLNIKFAIANVPQRTSLGSANPNLANKTTEYNSLLADAIPNWSTTESAVYLVDFADNYNCGPDNSCLAGHDGLHPNILGEFEIAQAFSKTLYSYFGLGSGPLQIPAVLPTRPCDVPANFNVVSEASGIVSTWAQTFGAYGYNVETSWVGFTEFTTPEYQVAGNRSDVTYTQAGEEWEVRVAAFCGSDPSGNIILSDYTSVGSAIANPQVPPGPTTIVTQPTSDGFTVYWNNPEGDWDISQYAVLFYDLDTPGSYLDEVGTLGNSVSIKDLVLGHRYDVFVVAWIGAGSGDLGLANPVTIGYGAPSAPVDLSVVSTDSTSVHITFDGDYAAAGYRVYTRNINNASDYLQASSGVSSINPCVDGVLFFPGIWNFEFCISAINGLYESALSTCIVAPGTFTSEGACPATVTRAEDLSTGGGTKLTGTGTACIAGTGSGDYNTLCAFTCSYNICPSPCTCTSNGIQVDPPATSENVGQAISGEADIINTLCEFACSRDVCPSAVCTDTSVTSSSPSLFPAQNGACFNGVPALGYGPWPCILCTNSSVGSTVALDVAWGNADTDDAVSEMISWYEDGAPVEGLFPSLPYDNAVAQWALYFNVTPFGVAPINRNCFLDSETCLTINICDANAPAGSLIFDSFSNIRHLYQSMYDGLTSAVVSISVETVASTFTTVTEDDDKSLDIFLQVLALGYGQFAAGIWNKILKDSSFFTSSAARKNDHGWFKDASNSMVSGSISIARSTAEAVEIALDQEQELSGNLSQIYKQFQTIINGHLDSLFNGSESGLADLENMLAKGAFSAASDQEVSSLAMQPILEETILSMLIPLSWSLSKDVFPVILVQPGGNNMTNPFTNTYYDNQTPGSFEGANRWGLHDSQANDTRITVGDFTLYMFKVYHQMDLTGRNGGRVDYLPGQKALTIDNTEWAGISYNDMVISSFQGYQINGNKNGYSIDTATVLDPLLYIDGEGTLGDFAFQNSFATPGYYSFPVCDVVEIIYNTFICDADCESYPCCGGVPDDFRDFILGGGQESGKIPRYCWI